MIAYDLIEDIAAAIHTPFDLDAFLALDGAARAAQWRGMTARGKSEAVLAMLKRRGGADATIDDTEVTYWVGRYDQKWSAAPAVPAAPAAPAPFIGHPFDVPVGSVLYQLASVLAAARPASKGAAFRAVESLPGAFAVFDGVTLEVSSASDVATRYVVDSIGCTCPGHRHPWCWHRAAYRMLTAYAAMVAPHVLVQAMVDRDMADLMAA